MREDVVTPAMARRLQKAGLIWQPQMGDWCTVLGGGHVGEAQAGLWLVAAAAPGFLGVMDAGGQWPLARVPARDYVWLPSAGKMKTLLPASKTAAYWVWVCATCAARSGRESQIPCATAKDRVRRKPSRERSYKCWPTSPAPAQG